MRICRVLASLCVLTLVRCCVAAGGLGNANAGGKVWLSDLDISKTQQGWQHARKDLSVDGNPLKIAGRTFERGVGTHADSMLYVELNGGSSRFNAMVGVDDEVLNPSENRRGQARQRRVPHSGATASRVYKSGMIESGDAAKEVDVDVTGVKLLVLTVDSGDDMNYDHADWADAYFTVTGRGPEDPRCPERRGGDPDPEALAQAADQQRPRVRRPAGLARAVHHRGLRTAAAVVLGGEPAPGPDAQPRNRADYRTSSPRPASTRSRWSPRTTWARPRKSFGWWSATRSP